MSLPVAAIGRSLSRLPAVQAEARLLRGSIECLQMELMYRYFILSALAAMKCYLDINVCGENQIQYHTPAFGRPNVQTLLSSGWDDGLGEGRPGGWTNSDRL